MSSDDSSNEKFVSFTMPDVSQVDQTKITKFSKKAYEWNKVGQGLNIQGKCK